MSDTLLGDFLRARRALARPEDHGMPAPGPRRTPGLRREEVAMLAGVSADYYVRLEQGRERHPSPRVVEALAVALSLDADARDYLHELAEPTPRRELAREPELAGPALVRLMDGWPTHPALTLGRYLDILAANPLGEALFAWMGEESNLVEAVFLNPAAHHFYRDWPDVAASTVAGLRANVGIDVDDPRLTDLVGRLGVRSSAFAELWGRHDVRGKTAEVKRFHHPVVGDLTLGYESFTVNSAPGQQVVIYHAGPDSPDEHALVLLGSYAADQTAPRYP
jgi:transcriptional regulator with XRE-family HTH domain